MVGKGEKENGKKVRGASLSCFSVALRDTMIKAAYKIQHLFGYRLAVSES